MRATRGVLRVFLAGLLVSNALAIPALMDEGNGDESGEDTDDEPAPRVFRNLFSPLQLPTEREAGPGRTVTVTKTHEDPPRTSTVFVTTGGGRTVNATNYLPTYITQFVPTYITGGATTISSVLVSTVYIPDQIQTQYITDVPAPSTISTSNTTSGSLD
jgi:hypothetical protein